MTFASYFDGVVTYEDMFRRSEVLEDENFVFTMPGFGRWPELLEMLTQLSDERSRILVAEFDLKA